jgi:hypothetical protein
VGYRSGRGMVSWHLTEHKEELIKSGLRKSLTDFTRLSNTIVCMCLAFHVRLKHTFCINVSSLYCVLQKHFVCMTMLNNCLKNVMFSHLHKNINLYVLLIIQEFNLEPNTKIFAVSNAKVGVIPILIYFTIR